MICRDMCRKRILLLCEACALVVPTDYAVVNVNVRLCGQVDAHRVSVHVRRVLDFGIVQEAGCAWGGGESVLALHVRGTAFLWHQVRLALDTCCGLQAPWIDCFSNQSPSAGRLPSKASSLCRPASSGA